MLGWTYSIPMLGQCIIGIEYSKISDDCGQEYAFWAVGNIDLESQEFTWKFGNGIRKKGKKVTHDFKACGSGKKSIEVSLMVKSGDCEETITKFIEIDLIPDASFGDQNIFSPFANCTDQPEVLVLENRSSTKSVNAHYSISLNETEIFSGSHFETIDITNYRPGLNQIKLVVTNLEGCQKVLIKDYYWIKKEYSIPSIGLEIPPSSSNECAPGKEITFTIHGAENNALSTQYLVIFSDNQDTLFFNHPPPKEIKRIFNSPSCGRISQGGFKDAFDVKIIAMTPCPGGVASATVEPIRVSGRPEAIIETKKPKNNCEGTVYTFVDKSNSNYYVQSSGSCQSNHLRYWEILPVNRYEIIEGSHSSESIKIRFLTSGRHSVRLRTNTPCGEDIAEREIEIFPEPTPVMTVKVDQKTSCDKSAYFLINNSTNYTHQTLVNKAFNGLEL